MFNWSVSPKGIEYLESDRCSTHYHCFVLSPTGDCFCIPICISLYIAGAKEIDIAATLEHLRDQRPGMVETKVLSVNPLRL